MSHSHFSTGAPCNCTFTAHLQHQAKTSGKLHDFLMNPKSRPDLQTPEGQAWLKALAERYWTDQTDPLMPWLTREWKKGRIGLDPHGGGRDIPRMIWKDPATATDLNPEGRRRPLSVRDLDHWADFYHSNHPLRRELGDIMQHHIGPFSQRIEDWSLAMEEAAKQQALQGGQVVHTTPDNWTVRKLTTPEELEAEGNGMGHCVGGYHNQVAKGDSLIYSLRDPRGYPHATTEIEPRRFQYPPEEQLPPNLQGTGLGGSVGNEMTHNTTPVPQGGRVIQIQGKANREPEDEYKARMADWFRTFPPEDRPSRGGSESDGMYDDNGYWHSSISHPDLIPTYEHEHGGLHAKPSDTEDEYGLINHKEPMLADYDQLLQNIKMHDYGSQGGAPDKDHMNDIYRLAAARGEVPKLEAALGPYDQEQHENLIDWMDQNWEHAPRYPDEPTGWEGEEDEYGEPQRFERETEGARPYWQIFPNESDPYNERYYDQAEAEKAYDWEYQNNWEGQHLGTQAASYMYNLINQPQQQTVSKTASKPPHHKNQWGDPCNCPWFKPSHKEHVGAIKEAAKIDWLRERPDVQKDPRKRLLVNNVFPHYPDEVDPLLPWVMREYNKGNLRWDTNAGYLIEQLEEAQRKYDHLVQTHPYDMEPAKAEYRDRVENLEYGVRNVINQGYGLIGDHPLWGTVSPRDYLPEFVKMMDSLKKRGQGIDVMQHSFHDMAGKWKQWYDEEQEREAEERRLNNGQVVHRFTDPEHKGWTVRRLTNRDECDLEGDLMGHCVGSYGSDVEGGSTNIYSLRDHKNQPHATMEIQPSNGRNPDDPRQWVIPQHVWDELPMKQFKGVPIEDIRARHDRGHYNMHDQATEDVYPEFMKKAVEHGTAMPPVEGEVIQTQGKSNQDPLEEYTEMLDQFMEPHGMKSYEPWWDDYYDMEGPENIRELVGSNGDDNVLGLRGYPSSDWHEGEPEEYNQARYDAEERGLPEPDLRVGNPDYSKILESIIDPPAEYYYDYDQRKNVSAPPWRGYNPQAGEYVLEHARKQDQWARNYPDNNMNANHMQNLANDFESHMKWELPQIEPYHPPQELLDIPDYWQRQRAIQEAEEEHHRSQGLLDDPWVQMYNHLGPHLTENFQPIGHYQPPSHQVHPEQMPLFKHHTDPEYPNDDYRYQDYRQPSYINSPDEVNPIPLPPTYQFPEYLSKVAHSIYKRWVFSPASGEVQLSDNSGDPFEVKYHNDLAREMNEPNLVHGYAYRIGDGWRLLDWEHSPVEDPFVIAQVMRKLQADKSPSGPEKGSWEPDYDEDWDRIHLGLPS